MLTQKRAKEAFNYHPDGYLVWKIKGNNRVHVGKIAGNVDNRGYIIVTLDKRIYRAHRIIFLYHHGYMPKEVDHIDTIRSNNKIENLRPATSSQNSQNNSKRSDNTSGYKGVSWNKKRKSWKVQIQKNYVNMIVGHFEDLIMAAEAYDKKAKELFGEFARTNFL